MAKAATFWSLVAHASNWATEAAWHCTYHKEQDTPACLTEGTRAKHLDPLMATAWIRIALKKDRKACPNEPTDWLRQPPPHVHHSPWTRILNRHCTSQTAMPYMQQTQFYQSAGAKPGKEKPRALFPPMQFLAQICSSQGWPGHQGTWLTEFASELAWQNLHQSLLSSVQTHLSAWGKLHTSQQISQFLFFFWLRISMDKMGQQHMSYSFLRIL